MENKSLLTFNVSCIVASKDTATDSSYAFIAGCVAHEYFHNWSGDRVTVRDWFQITLKEGFTNFRDHCFSEDNFGYTSRISDISDIKSAQFAEDASAMSHSIRPESYVAIDNFYVSVSKPMDRLHYHCQAAMVTVSCHFVFDDVFVLPDEYYIR